MPGSSKFSHRNIARGDRKTSPKEKTSKWGGMQSYWSAAVTGIDPLHDPWARTSHSVVPPGTYSWRRQIAYHCNPQRQCPDPENVSIHPSIFFYLLRWMSVWTKIGLFVLLAHRVCVCVYVAGCVCVYVNFFKRSPSLNAWTNSLEVWQQIEIPMLYRFYKYTQRHTVKQSHNFFIHIIPLHE